MEGLKCNDFGCIYYKREMECTATKVTRLNGKCVTRCSRDEVKGLMTKFKGGRKD